MSFTNIQEPDHIYFDLTTTNNDAYSNSFPTQQLVFNESRSNPFINDPEEYYLSIIRFRVETNGINLPLMIPSMDLSQQNIPLVNRSVNRLNYVISMRYQPNILNLPFQFQQHVYFTPQNVNVSAPTYVDGVQNNTNGYYNLNSYQAFTQMVNNAFENCLAGLNTITTVPSDTRPPFIQYDPDSGKFQLFAQTTIYGESVATTSRIDVYFGEALYNLFSSFQVKYQGNQILPNTGFTQLVEDTSSAVPPSAPTFTASSINYARYQLRFYGTSSRNNQNSLSITDVVAPYNNVAPAPYTYNAFVMFQDYVATANWCPVQSIVFTTSLLPVSPSLTAPPKVFNSLSSTAGGSASNLVLQITDIELLNESGKEFKPTVLYIPNPEYRLIDLYGNSPLSQLDINCFWKDRFGNSYPLYLSAGMSANIKIMFRKKTFETYKEKED